MKTEQIIEHCIKRLKMTPEQAALVAENIYIYDMPDWSEWSWRQINACFRGVLEAVEYVKKHGNPIEIVTSPITDSEIEKMVDFGIERGGL